MTAYELPKRYRLANFRPEKPASPEAARAARRKAKHEKRKGNSLHHLKDIRRCTCIIPNCGANVRLDVHHLKSGSAALERSLGRRATDGWVLPMCRYHHDLAERVGSRHELKWFLRNGGIADPERIAKRLFEAETLLDKQCIALEEIRRARPLAVAMKLKSLAILARWELRRFLRKQRQLTTAIFFAQFTRE